MNQTTHPLLLGMIEIEALLCFYLQPEIASLASSQVKPEKKR